MTFALCFFLPHTRVKWVTDTAKYDDRWTLHHWSFFIHSNKTIYSVGSLTKGASVSHTTLYFEYVQSWVHIRKLTIMAICAEVKILGAKCSFSMFICVNILNNSYQNLTSKSSASIIANNWNSHHIRFIIIYLTTSCCIKLYDKCSNKWIVNMPMLVIVIYQLYIDYVYLEWSTHYTVVLQMDDSSVDQLHGWPQKL